MMLVNKNCTLYSGGLKGAENCFGEEAEKWGVNEVNFCYEGQKTKRQKNLTPLSDNSTTSLSISSPRILIFGR